MVIEMYVLVFIFNHTILDSKHTITEKIYIQDLELRESQKNGERGRTLSVWHDTSMECNHPT